MSNRNESTWNTGSARPVGYNQKLHGSATSGGRTATTGVVSVIAGAGVGAVLMYLLDPEAGRQRRDYVADQAGNAADAVGSALGTAWQRANDAVHSASTHAHDAAAQAQDYAGRARDTATDAADRVSSLTDRARDAASGATDWVSSKFDDLRDAAPSRKTIQKKADPRNWFHHEPTLAERFTPTPAITIGAGSLAVTTLAAAYFFDPQLGRSRRARVQNTASRCANETGSFFRTIGRRIANRTQGITHEAIDRLTGRHAPTSDDQLAARIASELGHLPPHGKVTVDAENGTVYLRGTCAPDDVDALLKAAGSVQGVTKVVNHIIVTDSINTGGAGATPTTSAANQI